MEEFVEKRADGLAKAYFVAYGDYLTSEQRVAIERYLEISETIGKEIDMDCEGRSLLIMKRAAKEVPEGFEASQELWRIIDDLLLTGKFGKF